MTTKSLLSRLHDQRHDLETALPAVLDGWSRAEPALAGVTGLDDLLQRVRQHPDACLAALLRLGRAGQELALQAVFHAMVGVAVRAARGRDEVFGELVSELWLAIADYPLERRPRSIAANLAWAVRRGLGRPEVTGTPLAERASPVTEPDATAVLADARRCGLIDAGTHRTLWTVYVAGLDSRSAGRLLGTSAEVVRWRCSRALRRLRTHAELLAA